MPPRFPDESVTCLKRTMLARQPHFVFTTSDVENVMKETGLDKAQVWVWADNLRHRFKIKKLDDTLDFLRSKKEESIKVKRFFVSCFDVTPDFASTFEYRKSDEKDVNPIICMEAAFNREAMCGEFFIEFKNAVKDTDLIECLQNQEAKGVNVFTFPNDDGETAADAIIRVLMLQRKTGLQVARGKRTEKLKKRVDAKQEEAAKQELLSPKEFDEKTAAALNLKLEDVNGNVKGVMDSVQSHGVELVSHGAKLDSQVVVMEDIKHGVCHVIPDYQEKITKLEGALDHKTKMCDRIEGQKGRLTMEINKLKWELSESLEEKQQLREDKTSLTKKIHELLEQQDMYKSIALLKQMQEETQHTAEILVSTLAEERAAKRPRV